MQQGIGERSAPVAAARMDDEPRRFVDHDQRFVFVDDGKRDLLRLELCLRLGKRNDEHTLAAGETLLGLEDTPGKRDVAGVDPGAYAATRVRRKQSRERLVEA